MNLFLKAAKVLPRQQRKPRAWHISITPIKQMGSSTLWSPSRFLHISKAIVAVHTALRCCDRATTPESREQATSCSQGEPRESLGSEDNSSDSQESVTLPYCLGLLAKGKKTQRGSHSLSRSQHPPPPPSRFSLHSEAKLIQKNSPPVLL